MNKKRSTFAISPEVLEMLKELSKKNNRSQANMIEQLIMEAHKKLK